MKNAISALIYLDDFCLVCLPRGKQVTGSEIKGWNKPGWKSNGNCSSIWTHRRTFDGTLNTIDNILLIISLVLSAFRITKFGMCEQRRMKLDVPGGTTEVRNWWLNRPHLASINLANTEMYFSILKINFLSIKNIHISQISHQKQTDLWECNLNLLPHKADI